MSRYATRVSFTLTTAFFFLFITISNAQTWESISTPVETNLILFDVSFPAGQNEIGYAGGSSLTYQGKGTILKTMDSGLNWEIVYSSDVKGTGLTSIYFATPEIGFAGNMNGEVMRTVDGGMTWEVVIVDPNEETGEVGDIEFADSDHGVCATVWGGIYKTADRGLTWTAATDFLPSIHDLTYATDSTLFAVGNAQKIFKSTDGGHTWNLNYQGSGGFAVALGVHFFDGNQGMVTSEEGNIFITKDGGDTWTPIIVPGQYGLMRGAWIMDEHNYWATGTPGQVFKSEDGGQTWNADSEFDPNPSYYKIKFTDSGIGFVVGSGSNGGTILRKGSATGSSDLSITDLNIQITPNPVLDLIEINSTGDVDIQTILIYDMHGRIVLMDNNSAGDNKQFSIDASRLKTGMYSVLCLDEKKKMISRKLIVKK